MSFLYPRTISVTRPGVSGGVGALPYQGLALANETSIATGLKCSIQFSKASKTPPLGLPTSAISIAMWKIFIPKAAAALGLIRDHDVITDDQGERYQVTANYWNSLGYALNCERLES